MEIFKSWPFFAAFEKLIELRCLIPKDMISSHIELLPYLSLEGKGGRGQGRQEGKKGVRGKGRKRRRLCAPYPRLTRPGSCHLPEPRTQILSVILGRERGLDAGGGMVRLPGSGPSVDGVGVSPRYQEMQGNERPELSGYSGAS